MSISVYLAQGRLQGSEGPWIPSTSGKFKINNFFESEWTIFGMYYIIENFTNFSPATDLVEKLSIFESCIQNFQMFSPAAHLLHPIPQILHLKIRRSSPLGLILPRDKILVIFPCNIQLQSSLVAQMTFLKYLFNICVVLVRLLALVAF